MASETSRIKPQWKLVEGPTPYFFIFLIIVVSQMISYPLSRILPDPLFSRFESLTGTSLIRFSYLVSIVTFLVLLFVYRLFPCRRWLREFQLREATGHSDREFKLLWFATSFGTLVLCLVAFVRMGYSFPMFLASNISQVDYTFLRFNVKSMIRSEIIVICQYIFLPLNIISAFTMSKSFFIYRVGTTILFCLVGLFALERSTMVIPILVYLVARISFKPIKWNRILGSLSLAILISVFMVILSMAEAIDQFSTAFELYLGRVIHGQWLGLPAYLWFYSKTTAEFTSVLHPYIKFILGIESITPGTQLMIEIYPKIPVDATGNIPTMFIGEAYAIGGWPFVMFSIVHVSLFLSLCAWLFSRLPKTPLSCALCGIIVVKSAIGVVLGYSAFMFSQLTFFVLVVYLYSIKQRKWLLTRRL